MDASPDDQGTITMSDDDNDLETSLSSKKEALNASQGAKRDLLTFELPADQFPTTSRWFVKEKPVVIVLRSLTAEEELDAIRAANGDGPRVNVELAKACLYSFDGKVVAREDMEHEELWETIGPKCRNLVSMGFRQLWAASAEAVLKVQATFRVSSARV